MSQKSKYKIPLCEILTYPKPVFKLIAPTHLISNITVTDNSESKINAKSSITGSKVIVNFLQPVVPKLKLKLDLNNIKKTGFLTFNYIEFLLNLSALIYVFLWVQLGFVSINVKIFVAVTLFYFDYEGYAS